MKVFVDGVERYTWDVSTGLRGYDTPSGTYTARSMNEIGTANNGMTRQCRMLFSSPRKGMPCMALPR
jgi:hypothetical protein